MIEVRDPREETLEDAGELTLVDPETGEQVRVDTRSRALRERYAEAAAADRADVAANVRRAGADLVVLQHARRVAAPAARRALQARKAGDVMNQLRMALHAGRARDRADRAGARLSSHAGAARATPSRSPTSACCARSSRAPRRGGATCRSTLLLAALAAMVIGLARPQRSVAVERKQATVIMAMDTSGSMVAKDVSPTRLGAATTAAKQFVDGLPSSYKVSLVPFSTTASVAVAPTADNEPGQDGARQAARRTAARRSAMRSRSPSRSAGPPVRHPDRRRLPAPPRAAA